MNRLLIFSEKDLPKFPQFTEICLSLPDSVLLSLSLYHFSPVSNQNKFFTHKKLTYILLWSGGNPDHKLFLWTSVEAQNKQLIWLYWEGESQ